MLHFNEQDDTFDMTDDARGPNSSKCTTFIEYPGEALDTVDSSCIQETMEIEMDSCEKT